MGSLFLLLFIAFILAVLLWIVIKVPWWAKPLVIIIAFLAVTADGYLGRRKLEKMCQEQGGLHIYKTVENVEGFEIEYSEMWMRQSHNAYQYMEEPIDIKGRVNRVSVINGKPHLDKNVESKSRYLVHTDEKIKRYQHYRITKNTIVDKYDGTLLAEEVFINYKGGWINRLIPALYASEPSGYGCSKFQRTSRLESIVNLITLTLKPKYYEEK